MPNGKLEIVVDAEADFPEYVAGLENQIRKAMDG
jgi:hypothetical protein